jgi:hypothetical protein
MVLLPDLKGSQKSLLASLLAPWSFVLSMLLTGAIISLARSLFFLPSLSHSSELCHLASTNFLNQVP